MFTGKLSFAGHLLRLVPAVITFLSPVALHAQSSRPGWGATPYHDAGGTGVTFRVWAPNATSVFVPGQFNSWSTIANPLGKDLTNGVWNGVWSVDLTSASPGQQYKFYINYNGTGTWKHDPRGRWTQNSGSGANDIIYDPTTFNWAGDSLTPPNISDLVIYELHVGDFNALSAASLGKFNSAINRLDYLKSLGVSAVELLPIMEFPGSYSWGYNLADPYAANNNAYGGPIAFKLFVQACHTRGIAVLLDVVHNHYGPGDLDLWDFDGYSAGSNGGGIYFYQNSPQCCTTFGSRPDYATQQVRDYISDNFKMWLDEYHVDGFRWDTPGLMMNAGSTYIPEAATLITSINASMHTNYPGKFNFAEDVNGDGFDGNWDIDFHNYITPQLTNALDAARDMGAISFVVTNNNRFTLPGGFNRVVFMESHDVVGDLNNGIRVVTAIDSNTPSSYRARKLSTLGAVLTLTSPGVPMIFEGGEMLENQQFSANRPVDWTKTNTYSGIVRLYGDLMKLRRDLRSVTPGLKGDQTSMMQVDNNNKMIAYRRWKSAAPTQDTVVVLNCANTTWTNYDIPFPRAGNWYVQFNSDSTNYASDYTNVGVPVITANSGTLKGTLTIGPYSALILSQTPVSSPQLSLRTTNSVTTISWPTSAGAWVLDSAATLGMNSTSWTQVSSSQYQTNANSIYVNVTPSNARTFYRLRLP